MNCFNVRLLEDLDMYYLDDEGSAYSFGNIDNKEALMYFNIFLDFCNPKNKVHMIDRLNPDALSYYDMLAQFDTQKELENWLIFLRGLFEEFCQKYQYLILSEQVVAENDKIVEKINNMTLLNHETLQRIQLLRTKRLVCKYLNECCYSEDFNDMAALNSFDNNIYQNFQKKKSDSGEFFSKFTYDTNNLSWDVHPSQSIYLEGNKILDQELCSLIVQRIDFNVERLNDVQQKLGKNNNEMKEFDWYATKCFSSFYLLFTFYNTINYARLFKDFSQLEDKSSFNKKLVQIGQILISKVLRFTCNSIYFSRILAILFNEEFLSYLKYVFGDDNLTENSS